jgi:hypothetical protein
MLKVIELRTGRSIQWGVSINIFCVRSNPVARQATEPLKMKVAYTTILLAAVPSALAQFFPEESGWIGDEEAKNACPPGLNYFGPSFLTCHVECEDPTVEDILSRVKELPAPKGHHCMAGRYEGTCNGQGTCIENPPDPQ